MKGVATYAAIPTAGVFYLISSWLVMIFGGIVADDLGVRPFSYGTALVVTIGLWLAVAPLAGAVAAGGKNAG